jgi:hypothetical protein
MHKTRAEVAADLGVSVSTVRRAIGRANLHKKRGERLTELDVRKISLNIHKEREDAPKPAPKSARSEAMTPAPILHIEESGNKQEIVQLHERIMQLEKTVQAQQAHIVKLATVAYMHDGNISEAQGRIDFLDEWVSNLWYRMDHEPGTTDPRLRAAHLAQQRRQPQDTLDEGGRETVERLEAQDKETSAFFDALDKKRAG